MKNKVFIVLGVVLVIGILIGGGVFINQRVQAAKEKEMQQLQEEKEKQALAAEEEKQKLQAENEQKLADLRAEKEDLEAKEISLKVQKNEEFMSNGFTQKYYELGNELDDVSKELADVEFEISSLENNIFSDVSEIIDNSVNDIDKQDEIVSTFFGFSRFMFVIPIVIFVVAFAFIITVFVKNSKNMTSMFNGMTTKQMLNDLSDVAVKMAKDLNPSYEEFKCPNCGSPLNPENEDIKECEYCGAKLYKTVNKGKKK